MSFANHNNNNSANHSDKPQIKTMPNPNMTIGIKKSSTMNHPPVSPHLGIYRWEVTMLCSVLHRLTGFALWLFTLIFIAFLADQVLLLGNISYWLQEFFYHLPMLINKMIILLIIMLVSFTLSFHSLNGMRHLVWDLGWGLEIRMARFTAYVCLILSFLATLFITYRFWQLL